MKIDLRYIIPIVAFYVPGLLMLIGAWAVGYSTADVRDGVAIGGLFFGSVVAGVVVIACIETPPIWLRLWGKDD